VPGCAVFTSSEAGWCAVNGRTLTDWNRNRLTEKLGIDYPIIQGRLGGLSSQIDGGNI
jgi:hypothetical protein